jgi:hypothetical protein
MCQRLASIRPGQLLTTTGQGWHAVMRFRPTLPHTSNLLDGWTCRWPARAARCGRRENVAKKCGRTINNL